MDALEVGVKRVLAARREHEAAARRHVVDALLALGNPVLIAAEHRMRRVDRTDERGLVAVSILALLEVLAVIGRYRNEIASGCMRSIWRSK